MPLVMWWPVKALVRNMCKETVSLLCESVYVDEQLNTLWIRVSVDVSWNLIHHYSTDCITCTDNVSIPCVRVGLLTNWWLGKATTVVQLLQSHFIGVCALFCWINIVAFGLLIFCPWCTFIQWYCSAVVVLVFYEKRSYLDCKFQTMN